MIKVCEVFFGIQGEGPSSGVPALFIRTYGCPLRCTWCDTPFSYDNKDEMFKIGSHYIIDKLTNTNVRKIIFTGGEPMAQQKAISEIMDQIMFSSAIRFIDYEFETAGIYVPNHISNHLHKVQWNVSPKLENSGNSKKFRYKREALETLNARQANFKFVVSNQADLDEVKEMQADIKIPNRKMWLMPEGVERKQIIKGGQWLTDVCVKHGYNLALRNHVVLFGDKRGV